jgi:hypothetical protein
MRFFGKTLALFWGCLEGRGMIVVILMFAVLRLCVISLTTPSPSNRSRSVCVPFPPARNALFVQDNVDRSPNAREVRQVGTSSVAEEQFRENLINYEVLAVGAGPTAMAADTGHL